MTDTQKNIADYQLRYAAGKYWLLDMKQKGVPYKRPMIMNSMGAKIWNLMTKNWSIEQITTVLIKEYDVTAEEIREDIVQFQKQLTAFGVAIGE